VAAPSGRGWDGMTSKVGREKEAEAAHSRHHLVPVMTERALWQAQKFVRTTATPRKSTDKSEDNQGLPALPHAGPPAPGL